MNQVYVIPEYKKEAFNCPYCNAYAKQVWQYGKNYSQYYYNNVDISKCEMCGKNIIWYERNIVFPKNNGIVMPNNDLTEEIKKDYLEARIIFNDSPKGACALLRLCLQKLCIQLGEDGKNINNNIKSLVSKGLSSGVQKALDTVRIFGNESVHPGEINIDDNIEIAKRLFDLINFIADKMLTEPKELELLYSKLPENKIKEIENRDSTKQE